MVESASSHMLVAGACGQKAEWITETSGKRISCPCRDSNPI